MPDPVQIVLDDVCEIVSCVFVILLIITLFGGVIQVTLDIIILLIICTVITSYSRYNRYGATGYNRYDMMS
jgi:hypothetical protein